MLEQFFAEIETMHPWTLICILVGGALVFVLCALNAIRKEEQEAEEARRLGPEKADVIDLTPKAGGKR